MSDLVDRAQHKLVLLAVQECLDVIRDHGIMSGLHEGHFAMEVNDILAFSLFQTYVRDRRDPKEPEKLLHIHADRVRKLIKAYAKEHG